MDKGEHMYTRKFDKTLTEAKVPEGFDKFIKKLLKFTDNNEHGLARKEIAKFFGFKKEEQILEMVNKIHDLHGRIYHNLSAFREDVANDMFTMIEKKYGKKIKEQVYGSL